MTSPRISISQISTLNVSFADDLEAYRAAGVEGVGIWELKIPEDGDAEALEQLEASGLVSTNAVPLVPSILPLPLLEGPPDPDERVDAICRSLHRLAPFRPTTVVCLTGPAGALGRDRAHQTVVDGLRTLVTEATGLGLRIGLEPYSTYGAVDWTIVSTIPRALELLDEAGAGRSAGLTFDVWHLWNSPSLEEQIAAHADRFAAVHVCDWREPTRGFADRVLPGEGVADVPRILEALERAGWDGFWDIEIFSDNGAFGSSYPDSLWNLPAGDFASRARAAFLACWERRTA